MGKVTLKSFAASQELLKTVVNTVDVIFKITSNINFH